VLIRHSLQRGWLPLLKTCSLEHLQENQDVNDFVISQEDMDWIESWDEGSYGAIRMCPRRSQKCNKLTII